VPSNFFGHLTTAVKLRNTLDQKMTENEENVSRNYPSPCIRNCCLDDRDMCFGCHRTLDEIVGWSTSNDKEKKKILHQCKLRKISKGVS